MYRTGIVIPPELETRLRAHAEAEGPTVKAYIERLVSADEQQKQNLQIWRWKDSVQVDCYTRIADPDYWENKHWQLDERLKNSGRRWIVAMSPVQKRTRISITQHYISPNTPLPKLVTAFYLRPTTHSLSQTLSPLRKL